MSKIITSVSDDHLEQCVKALHRHFRHEIKPGWWRDDGLPPSYRENKYARDYDVIAQWSAQRPGDFRIHLVTHDNIAAIYDFNIVELSHKPELFGAFLHDLGMAIMVKRRDRAQERVPEFSTPPAEKTAMAAAIEQANDARLDYYGADTSPLALPSESTVH